MDYLDFIGRFHEVLAPRTYLEVGIRAGGSLARSRCRSIGIDPAFNVTEELLAPVSLYRMTSDDYFDALGSRSPFEEAPVDLAFIDGMHLFEFALRDFLNLERQCASSSVVIFDDVMPRNQLEAARERETQAWTGDVFRVVDALSESRPDLSLTLVDTQPTGLLLVSGLDPSSTVLAERFDELAASPAPPVPEALLERRDARPPEDVLGDSSWARLRHLRDERPRRWLRR